MIGSTGKFKIIKIYFNGRVIALLPPSSAATTAPKNDTMVKTIRNAAAKRRTPIEAMF